MKKVFVFSLLLSVAQSNCMSHAPESPERVVASVCYPNGGREDYVGCNRVVTNEDLISVAKVYPNLVSINLSGCYHVTVDGLEILAKLCKKLTSIALYDSITSDSDDGGMDLYGPSIGRFEKKYPNIQIIKRSPQELEREQRQKEYEEKVRKIKEAQEEERRKRKKDIQDILGDDSLID